MSTPTLIATLDRTYQRSDAEREAILPSSTAHGDARGE